MKTWQKYIILGVLIATVAFGLACATTRTATSTRPLLTQPEVTISHLPDLYEPFTVTAKVTAIEQDEDDVELWLNVSGVYLDGEDRWHGPLKKGEEKTITATFAFVTEGNRRVSARSASTIGVIDTTLSIKAHVTSQSSKWGSVISDGDVIVVNRPGPPHIVHTGHTFLVDTSLALNQSQNPRVEFIRNEEDIERLQEEGLLPQELRYQWRFLKPGYRRVDFSHHFFIAYFDGVRPKPGQLTQFEGNQFVWDNSTLTASYKTYAVPDTTPRADMSVSPVEIIRVARDIQPTGVDVLALEGTRTFEFIVDDELMITKSVDIP